MEWDTASGENELFLETNFLNSSGSQCQQFEENLENSVTFIYKPKAVNNIWFNKK